MVVFMKAMFKSQLAMAAGVSRKTLMKWLWPNRIKRKEVEAYLQVIQSTREEIRLEVTEM